jgi:PTH1 family peptidyl-tRNA hydrolase
MLRLVVGLGNPGPRYAGNRHNVGFWWLEALARNQGAALRPEGRFHGEVGRLQVGGQDLWLLAPTTYMNHSGQAVGALARFYKLAPEEVLVVHDELDLPPGTVRLKQGGGHGGHNGLRDIVAHLGSREFYRLRLGIGHPGDARRVVDYVLSNPPAAERELIEDAMDDALRELPDIAAGDVQKAMRHLHARRLVSA